MTDERAEPRLAGQKLLGLEPLVALVASRLGGGAVVHVGRRSAVVGLSALPSNPLRPLLVTRVMFVVGDAPGEVTITPKLIDALIGTVLPHVRATDLSASTRMLALEAALADALDELEMRLGATITITGLADARHGESLPANIGLKLSIDGASPLLLPAHLPDAIVRKLLTVQAGTDSGKAFDPEVPLAVRIGRCTSTVGVIQDLALNDILLLDDTLLDDNLVCLMVDDILGCLGELDGKSLRLDGPLRSAEDAWLQRFSATMSARRPGNGSNGSDTPYVVMVDLAYRMAKASELLRIEIEEPIPLPQGIDGVVEIRAHRKRIALGRLARTSSGIGVRITRIDPHAGI
jgi:flagellar motor switch/type III secretory pathway protein FliN